MHPNQQFSSQPQEQMYSMYPQQGYPYQQQMYMRQYEEQMRRMAYEQETLRRELEQQKKERLEMEKKMQKKRTELDSRDRERNALAMINAFEKSAGLGGDRGFGDFFREFGGAPPPIKAETPIATKGMRGSLDINPSPNTFQKTASMMISPNYGGGPQGMGGYQPFQPQATQRQQQQIPANNNGLSDPNFILKLLELVKKNKEPPPQKSHLSEMISASLEKQNMILSALARGVAGGGVEDETSYNEKKSLERKIAQLEMELELKRGGDSLDLFSRGGGGGGSSSSTFHY